MNKQSGFSMIETLLAAALAVIVAIAMVSMLSSSLTTAGNSGNKINFLTFVELLNDRLQYPVYCSAHIAHVPFDLSAAQTLDPMVDGMPISFDLTHDGLGSVAEALTVPEYNLTVDRLRFTGAQAVTENTIAGVGQDNNKRYNVLLSLQATLQSGTQLRKPIGSFTILVRPDGIIEGCEKNSNMDIDNCSAHNKIYMPFAIPGTNSADPQYQPDQYGCINPDIISTGPVIIKPGPVLPAPGPGPKPSDQDLKRELSPYEDISFGANQELENEKIFKLINTVKRQNLTLRKMRVELETQKRNYEKN